VVKLYNIASTSTLKKWVIAYKREGESALQVKTKGRPRGSNKVAQLERSELEAVRFEVSRLSKKLAVRE
ncbi:MAG: helix-turn-helix domain-containing protein, partial [Raoultibacter sp.]